MRFGLTWPTAWTVVSWETCGSATAIGDLAQPGDGLIISFAPCTDTQQAAVRVVMNCTQPGRFSFITHPSGGFDFRDCNSPKWHPYDPIFTYVEIGDYCGASPLSSPCGHLCSSRPAGSFNPPRIDAAVYEGGETTVPLSVYLYDYCPVLPECCTMCFGTCRAPLEVTEPWVQLEAAGPGAYGADLYVVHLNASSLSPGIYSGRIVSGEPFLCGFCHSICMEVNLEVLACAPPLEPRMLPSGVLRRVPDDYPTISAALAASTPGDTVGVRAGSYVDSFSPRDGVAILGGYDPDFVMRDPANYPTTLTSTGRIATALGCVGETVVIDGFILTGGAGEEGGLMRVQNASPTISNNRFIAGNGGRGAAIALEGSPSLLHGNTFVNNESSESGGALSISGADGTVVSDCRFEANTSVGAGGGVFIDGSFDVLLRRCTFLDNQSSSDGGGLILQNSRVVVDSCVFAGNQSDRGGAIALFSSYVSTVTNCTIADNAATSGGGVYVAPNGRVAIHRTIVADNNGRGIFGSGATVDNSCNDVWNNQPTDYVDVVAGPNSFSLDPLFCDTGGRDFTLEVDSPCAPANSPVCGLVGALPPICARLFIRVPDDHSSILEAMNASQGGDTVAVAEGHYLERVTLKDRVRLLGGWRSDFGDRDPMTYPSIIDAGGFLGAVVAQNGESRATLIDGFVITGGNRIGGTGGGVECFNASPTIRNNVFLGNRAGRGAAISCRTGALPLIVGNVLIGNVALDPPGAAIYVETDSHLESNTLDGNQGPWAAGIAVRVGARPIITRSIVVNGQGIGIFADQGSVPQLSCNDVWQNSGGDYYGVLPGPHALSLDPGFCPGKDRFLREDSPCAPANAPAVCGLIGARDVGCAATGSGEFTIIPLEHWIGTPCPNPMNPASVLAYGIASAAQIRLTIIDLAGREVRTLVNGIRPAGEYRVYWDGRDDPGRTVASGVYFYRLAADGRLVGKQKVLVLR
jgi:hypothetical protein